MKIFFLFLALVFSLFSCSLSFDEETKKTTKSSSASQRIDKSSNSAKEIFKDLD